MLTRHLLATVAIVAMSGSAAFADSTSQHHQRSHHTLYEQRLSYPAVGLHTGGGAAIYDNIDFNYGDGYLSGHDALVQTF